MKVTVEVYAPDIKPMYDTYKEHGGEKTEQEVAQILVEDLLLRYLGEEYFDLTEIRQLIDG